MAFQDDINRILRDHEGYTGDGRGSEGPLPVGDRSTARRPINKRDLRDAFGLFAQSADAVSEVAAGITAADTIEVTVGTGGQYASVTAALAALSTKVARRYRKEGVRGRVRLLTGFVMAEQIIIRDGLDLSWVEIVSDAAEVTVNRDAITTIVRESRRPVFSAVDRGVLPVIRCKFRLGTGTLSSVDGVAAFHGGRGLLGETSGFIGFSRNIGVYCGSEINLYIQDLTIETIPSTRPDFSGALDTAAYVSFNSRLGMPYGKFDGAGNHGVLVIWGSHADLYRATALNVGGCGLYARDGATANAREMDVSGAGQHGFYALHGSRINARCQSQGSGYGGANNCALNGVFAQQESSIEADAMMAQGCGGSGIRAEYGSVVNARIGIFDACNVGVSARAGSTISAQGARANGVLDVAVFAEGASRIDAASGTFLNAGQVGITARRASTVNAQGVTATGAGLRGAQATQSSTINAGGGNFRKNPASDTTGTNGDLVVFDGGQISATGATGGLNVTPNTINADGIIWRPA